MKHLCPGCHNELKEFEGDFVCKHCKQVFSRADLERLKSEEKHTRRPADSRGVARGKKLLPLIPKLPSTLALILDTYTREEDDYIALHAMCHAIEITARFLTVIVLADVWQRRPSSKEDFPENLREALYKYLAMPTLTGWVEMLREARKALPTKGDPSKGQKESLLSGLPEYINAFMRESGKSSGVATERLLPMRNLLAHGGRISDETVAELIKAHTKRFEKLMFDLKFLSEDAGVALVAGPAEGTPRLLRGLSVAGTEYDRLLIPEEFRQMDRDRMLLVVSPDNGLDLFPLHAYGEVFHLDRKKKERISKEEEAIHLYSRKQIGVDYTALGGREIYSCGDPAWETIFDAVFRLRKWEQDLQKGELVKYAFNERMNDLLHLFIGRDEQVHAAVQRINVTDSDILYLGGKPGMGKSAFMAKLMRDYFQQQPQDTPVVSNTGCVKNAGVICIPYFFSLSDADKCRTSSFVEAALLHLDQHSEQRIKIDDDPQKREIKFRNVLRDFAKESGKKILFFIDGLDEIASADLKFLNLLTECQHPNTLWICAGRTLVPQASRLHSPLEGR